MHDAVADVLLERAQVDRGAGAAVVASIALHAALTAVGVWAAMRTSPPRPVTTVNIQFASMPRTAAAVRRPAARPTVEAPKTRIEEPRPPVEKKPAKPEKGTVPFSAFGRSTKKGSESPPAPEPPRAAAGLSADVPVGGAGVTGLEGGDFPYTLYIDGMQRRIGANWFRPRQVAPGTATIVRFRIRRNGTIAEAAVETPSGSAAFDRAALSAVLSSSPLNPLPFGYTGTYLGVHLTFR